MKIVVMKSDREYFSIIRYCLMSASNPEVDVDHESDLSSSWKPVLSLGFLFLQTGLFFWSGNSYSHFVQAFQNFASDISKFVKFFPSIDREDFNSSNESTISDSLIHNKASDGKSEQVVTWCFESFSPIYENVEDAVNLCICCSDICCLCTGNVEVMVDGLLANLGIGIVSGSQIFISCARISCTNMHWNRSCNTLVSWSDEFLENDFGMNRMWKLITKTFSCCPDVFHVSSGNLLSRPSIERELGDWKRKTISHCDSIPLLGIHLTPFIEFLCSCLSRICEVSLRVVSWLSLNFCKEKLPTRSSWALFISPISCIFRIWVSRSTFSFRDNSSCGRDCSLRVSIFPRWAFSSSNLWA